MKQHKPRSILILYVEGKPAFASDGSTLQVFDGKCRIILSLDVSREPRAIPRLLSDAHKNRWSIKVTDILPADVPPQRKIENWR